MESINPVRVQLFSDSEIARNAYGPYFTGTIRKSWTLPTNRIISHSDLVKKILKYQDMDPNLWNVRMTMRVPTYCEAHLMFYFNLYSMNNDEEMRYLWTIPADISKEGIHILVEFEPIEQQNIPITHDMNTTSLPEDITAVTQMVSYEPSMLYSAANNDDDEIDRSDGDEVVSSQSESDNDNESEEGEFQTPINPANLVNPVTENTVQQWESSQRFSNARYIGSGSPVDDIIESGTVRLLDWNNSMTDIQLGMGFVDKVQAVSAVRKYSVSVGREHRVLKMCRENGSRTDAYVPEIYLRQTYIKTYQANFHPVLSENFWRDVPFNLTFYPPNMKNERGRKQGKQFQGEMDYRNPDSPPRYGRCRMPGHNRKNCNNPGTSNV
ncbi:hypothetical protein M9H77_29828 [Catharanthus roseus]|uniref:Uncharacterized protein n=1 Tax=Catharanthus roseus TaxID=4058 RepID=A0ACB9ZWF7_CATRO|nr:hypothetical protein M9H77_29828 [Catharanthus roseus]